MARKISHLPAEQIHFLSRFGERLRLLRMRQRLTAKQVAAAAGMSVMTLRSLERGSSGVTMGAYVAVMGVLGIEHDLESLGASAFAGMGAIAVTAPSQRLPDGDAVPAPAPTPQTTPSGDGSPNSGPVSDHTAVADRATDIDAGVVLSAGEAAAREPFDWLDAPAQDLRQLMRPGAPSDGRTAAGQERSDALQDLFDDREAGA